MPVAFMLLFVYVFGGAVKHGSGSYVTYLLPGILLITIASGISYTAYRLFLDMKGGIFERFQSMPIARSSVLWSHVLTSLVANLISLAVVAGVALLMGFRSRGGRTCGRAQGRSSSRSASDDLGAIRSRQDRRRCTCAAKRSVYPISGPTLRACRWLPPPLHPELGPEAVQTRSGPARLREHVSIVLELAQHGLEPRPALHAPRCRPRGHAAQRRHPLLRPQGLPGVDRLLRCSERHRHPEPDWRHVLRRVDHRSSTELGLGPKPAQELDQRLQPLV